jgi:hypothetical protein
MEKRARWVKAKLPDGKDVWELWENEKRTEAKLMVRSGRRVGYIGHVEIPVGDVDYAALLKKCVADHRNSCAERMGTYLLL